MNVKQSEMVDFHTKRYRDNDPNFSGSIRIERWKCDIAQIVYDLRENAALSQEELALKINRPLETIEQIENGDYDGNVLEIFGQISNLFDKKFEIREVV